MDNKKKLTVAIAIFAVVCVFAVLVFTGVLGDGIQLGKEEETTEAEYAGSAGSFSSAVLTSAQCEQPYLETDIENIYFTMSEDGNVSFFSLEEGIFSPVEATGTYDVSVVMSEQDVTAEITYYQLEDEITGYGLYTAEAGTFNLYPYVFFRLANYGENYEDAYSTSCLLLADTTEDDFYSNEKIYEEQFIFEYETADCSRLLSGANRTVGLDGALRDDYAMVNDSVIDGSWDTQLFFSGRQYAEDDERVDLLSSGGSGNNLDNIRMAKDVLGYFATYTDDGIIYITVDDNDNVIVEKLLDSDETETVKTFDGVTRDMIIVDDDCILIADKKLVYDISEDKEINLGYQYAKFTADMFEVSDDKILIRGYEDNRYPTIVICDKESGNVLNSYSDEILRNAVNPVFAGDYTMISTKEANGFKYYFF